MRRAFAPRIPERIGENEPSFGVGVRDLDRLAVRGAQDVTGPKRVTADDILGRGDDADDADRNRELRRRSDSAEDGGAAGHVPLHVLELQRRLDREAPGVERDRLADEAERELAARVGARVIAEDDQPRRIHARAADRGQRAHAQLVDSGGIDHINRQVREPQLRGALGEKLRCQLVRRSVDEVARPVDPPTDLCGTPSGFRECRVVCGEDDPLEILVVGIARLPAVGRRARFRSRHGAGRR